MLEALYVLLDFSEFGGPVLDIMLQGVKLVLHFRDDLFWSDCGDFVREHRTVGRDRVRLVAIRAAAILVAHSLVSGTDGRWLNRITRI